MKPGGAKPQFWSVKLEIPCGEQTTSLSRRIGRILIDAWPVAFIKVADGLDPVELVHRICEDAQAEPGTKRGRWVKRMTPMTLIRKTLGSGLEDVCERVLKPHFHSGGGPKKVSPRAMREPDSVRSTLA